MTLPTFNKFANLNVHKFWKWILTENTWNKWSYLAVLKTQKIHQQAYIYDKYFWSIWPWKNPGMGKTSETECVLLISSFSGNYTFSKLKPAITNYNLSLSGRNTLRNFHLKFVSNSGPPSHTVRTVPCSENTPRIFVACWMPRKPCNCLLLRNPCI